MTAVPASRMPPTGNNRVTAIADALGSASEAATLIPAAYLEPGHPRSLEAHLLGSLASIVTQLALGLDTEANANTPDAARAGERMTDAGVEAFLHQPFLQHVRNGCPSVPMQRHTHEDGTP